MYWLADFRLKVEQLVRKYSRIIVIGLFIWAVVLAVNSFLKGYTPELEVRGAYNPHTSIMETVEKVPDSLKNPITELIDIYFNYCQNKDYQSAYNMLMDSCKKKYFPTIADFQEYIDSIFDDEKTYYIQNYSNYKNSYVYQMRIFENVMKTGLTGKSNVSFYEEKITVKEVDGELKLGLRQFITSEKMDEVYEDNYLKIWIENRDVYYEQEVYTVRIRNKSEFIAVLADGTETNEVLLMVGSNIRDTLNSENNIVLMPNDTTTYTFSFTKFYDEEYLSNKLVFDAVRILRTYSMIPEMRDYEFENAEKLYSIQIPI